MKKSILILLLAMALCLGACTEQAAADTRVLVSIVELEGCSIENNGQWVAPGAQAVFILDMDEGCSLAGTDYTGAYNAVVKDGKMELTLEAVQYPVRVNLELTRDFASITYDPNGGMGSVTTVEYDLTWHIRPNTSTGTGLFTREGFTLTGWNTEPDGSGLRIGLGSRVTADESLTLYAQWEPWTDVSEFTYKLTNYRTVTISGYTGSAETVVIPAYIDGCRVTTISARAFQNSTVRHLILPETMEHLAPQAFLDCAELETVTLFDKITTISDEVFDGCGQLRTLYINAREAPFGYEFRKESVYADKVDLLIAAQGQRKLVLYSGCSGWYNLDGAAMDSAFGETYAVINMGLNGTVNSTVQMQILSAFLEEGDVLLHTLELTSEPQLLIDTSMGEKDDKLWCGLEYNYDLLTLVDLRTVDGVFDSLSSYLEKKDKESSYIQHFTDSEGRVYLDQYGCIPFYREGVQQQLADKVNLDPEYVDAEAMARLEAYYDAYRDMGVRVYVSYACVNMDEVPQEEQGNVELMNTLMREAIGAMDSAVLISELSDYIYGYSDFFDTNYHLNSAQTARNTETWIRDLKAQMIRDGLWQE